MFLRDFRGEKLFKICVNLCLTIVLRSLLSLAASALKAFKFTSGDAYATFFVALHVFRGFF